MVDDLPSYDELLARTDAPAGSSWGLWGEDDVFGCLNHLTPERVARAAQLVEHGKVFALGLDADLPDPPLFGRPAFEHDVTDMIDGTVHDDTISAWNTQSSSQWDGFRHVAHRAHGFYNGIADESHGIDHWARRGIAGRGVLADVARWRSANGVTSRPGEADQIEADEIAQCLTDQGTEREPGDILLVRTGWLSWYRALDADERARTSQRLDSIGLARGEALLRYLWDGRYAAVAADNPALETFPPGAGLDPAERDRLAADPELEPEVFAHRAILALLGLPIGELWDLDVLAQDCASDGRYDFFLTSAPLCLPRGVASPPNALALK